MTDCVLKRLYDQNLSGAEDLELVCGKKRAVGEFTACVCVFLCALAPLNPYRWSAHLGTGCRC